MVIKEVAETTQVAVKSMQSVPLAIALLMVNVGFLAFAGYVLGHVAANAQERNKNQMDLIEHLVKDIRDCKQQDNTPPYPNPRPKETP